MLKRDIDQLASRLGWHIIHYEKYPKYEPITEFMNQALIPIGFLAAFLITLLAFWSSTLESVGHTHSCNLFQIYLEVHNRSMVTAGQYRVRMARA